MALRVALAVLILLAAATAAAVAWVRLAPDDPVAAHADPLAARRPGTPNDVLLAPEGAAAASPDRAAPVWETTPEALMRAFDAMALAQPRTERLAGEPESLHVTYVQRSAVWGFPDYVSVKALPAGDGATLAIWSRSRYGRSDLGVNAARVSAWLDALRL